MSWEGQSYKVPKVDPAIKRGIPKIPQHKLEVEWHREERILLGFEEIARYLRCSLSSIRRYVHNAGLPAMQRPDGMYITSTSLIDQWILAVSNVQAQQRMQKKGQDGHEAGETEEPTW